MSKDIQAEIDSLRNEIKQLDEQATIAYKNGNIDLEMKYQKRIDKNNLKIDSLETKLISLQPKIDWDDSLQKAYKTHSWDSVDSNCRCWGCGMKRETFQSKRQGVIDSKDEFQVDAKRMLELMYCKQERNAK